MTEFAAHSSVLLTEAIDGLALQRGATAVDCTVGGGGHTRAIAEKIGSDGTLIGFDLDASVLESLEKELGDSTNLILVPENFRSLAAVLARHHVTVVDAILADLGWRSDQFLAADGDGKGFSFQKDEPLLMTYGSPEDYLFTAADVVNDWEESSLADIIYSYGEERQARRIAHKIVESRAMGQIETAAQLAQIIFDAVPRRFHPRHIHPATKTFQAIRMVVNDELGSLRQLINDGFPLLRPGGRLAIISFHSLEDRLVKRSFKALAAAGSAALITKTPIIPTTAEVARNARSRSAKLRIIKKA